MSPDVCRLRLVFRCARVSGSNTKHGAGRTLAVRRVERERRASDGGVVAVGGCLGPEDKQLQHAHMHVGLRLASWPFVTAQEPGTSHQPPRHLQPYSGPRHQDAVQSRGERVDLPSSILSIRGFTSRRRRKTRASFARDGTRQNGVQESDNVQRLLGGNS